MSLPVMDLPPRTGNGTGADSDSDPASDSASDASHARVLGGAGQPAVFAGTWQSAAVRSTVGVLAIGAALAMPWLGLNLAEDPSAWSLTFSLGAVPLVHHLSYGVVVVILLAVTVVSLVRSLGRPTTVSRAVGWAYVALSVVFVVSTRLDGAATLFALQSDANQSQIINSQFLTNNDIPAPSTFLGIGFDSKTLLVLLALRLGWYSLLAGGLLLAGRLRRPSTLTQRAALAACCGVLALVLVGLVLGSLAQSDLDNGIQAVASGRPVAGEHLLATAVRLNPQLAYDSGLEQSLGQAQADLGHMTGLADYAEAVRPVSADLDLLEQSRLFARALAAVPATTPAGAVIRSDVSDFLATATISSKNPDLLTLVNNRLLTPAVAVSVGHYYYEAGADSLAISMLSRVQAETTNAEVRSLALTYMALAWQRLGDEARFRTAIVAAVHDDTLNENVYAREIAAGLYVPGNP